VTGLSLKFELSERTNQIGLTIYLSLDFYALESYKMCILCEQEGGGEVLGTYKPSLIPSFAHIRIELWQLASSSANRVDTANLLLTVFGQAGCPFLYSLDLYLGKNQPEEHG
jgi:hypothetical protein